MKQINVNGLLLNEEQISNLINNAKELKIEKKILKEEIASIKEGVQWVYILLMKYIQEVLMKSMTPCVTPVRTVSMNVGMQGIVL